MDIFFSDPSDIPLPPNEVRIRQFEAQPWQDKRRVHIFLEVTPFQKRPNGEINISNARGEELASVSIIEMIEPKMEFTVHLRGAELIGPCTAVVLISYPEEPESPGSGQESLPEPQKQLIVDRASANFILD